MHGPTRASLLATLGLWALLAAPAGAHRSGPAAAGPATDPRAGVEAPAALRSGRAQNDEDQSGQVRSDAGVPTDDAAPAVAVAPPLAQRAQELAPDLGDVRAELAAIGDDPQDPALTERRERLERIEARLVAAAEARAERDRDRTAAEEAATTAVLLEARLAEAVDTDPPTPETPPTLEEAERQAAEARGELATVDARIDELERELELRETSSTALPDELSKARLELDAAEQSFLAAERAPAGTEPMRLRELAAAVVARRANEERLLARRALLEATEAPLTLERALLERRRARAELVLGFWSREIERLERARSRVAAEAARAEAESLRASWPTLAEFQEETQALIEQLGALEPAEAARKLERVGELGDELVVRAATTRRKVAVGGLTRGTGRLLRSEYDWLQTIEPEVRAAVRVREQNSLDEIRLEQATADRRAFTDHRAAVARLAERAGIEDPERRAAFEARALPLVEQRHAVLGELRDGLREVTRLQVDRLEGLEALERLYGQYRDFVSGEILWVPSTVGGRDLDPGSLGQAFLWLIDPDQWHAVGRILWLRASASPVGTGLWVGLILFGFGLRRKLKRRIRALGERVRSYRTDTFPLTLRALVLSVAIALPAPLALWLVADLGADAGTRAPLLDALADALRAMAPVAFALAFLRALCTRGGVAEVHFRWSSKAIALLRPHLAALETVVLPAGVLFHLFEAGGVPAWNDTLGRIAFIVAMGAVVLFAWRVLRPETGLLSMAFARNTDALLHRTRRGWFAVGVGLPAALLLFAALDYYYTAQQLEQRLEQSVALILVLVVVNGLLLRWLFVARRRLAVEQARKRAQQRVREAPEDRVSEAGVKLVDEDLVDIPALDAQTRRLFRSGITLTALLGVYLIWSGVLPALGGLDRVQLWPTLEIVESERFEELDALTAGAAARVKRPADAPPRAETTPPPAETGSGRSSLPLPSAGLLAARPAEDGAAADASAAPEPVVTLADVALALIFLLVALVAARNVPALVEISILQRLAMDGGERYAVSTLVRYGILIVGASTAFGALGVGWEKIQWLAAALTFGLAFGLQEIFANFVSGIIILLERPVRIGDIVTVAGTEGTVTRLRMRATTVMDWDRRELLVPNKEFITGSIINWSLSDPVTRIQVDVGVAYGSDVRLALDLLRKVAEDCPHVLDQPAPQAWFRHFGDSALILRQLSFIPSRDAYWLALDHLHREVDRVFREHGIEIAFPQRDLHVRSARGLQGVFGDDAAGRARGDTSASAPADDDGAEGQAAPGR